jgi:hypothetical protein
MRDRTFIDARPSTSPAIGEPEQYRMIVERKGAVPPA